MKKALPKSVRFAFLPAALVLGALAVPGALAQDPSGDSTQEAQQGETDRVEILEAALAEEVRLHAETRARLDQVVQYLSESAATEKAQLAVLAKVEELGFTAGINPESREVLLDALRSAWSAPKTVLPLPPVPVEETAQRRRGW